MLPFEDLVSRVIRQESGGNPHAVNKTSGAAGIMQIMPATAASPGFGVTPMPWDQRFDAAVNRQFGEQYLGAMLDRYKGDEARALAAYNWGPGNADKWDGNMASLPAETRGYISNILGSTANAAPIASASAATPTAAAAAPIPEETLKLFGLDTKLTAKDLQTLGSVGDTEKLPAMQAPQIQRGPGYVKQRDSLTAALEAFNATRQRRA